MQRLSLTFVTLAVCNILGVAPLAARFVPLPPLFQTNTMFVGVSPLSIPFDIGSVEIEGLRNAGDGRRGCANYAQFQAMVKSMNSRRVKIKLRFYPDNVAFSSLSFDAGLGVTEFRRRRPTASSTSARPDAVPPPATTKQTLDAPTLYSSVLTGPESSHASGS